MKTVAYHEGRQAWYKGVGWVQNPYNVTNHTQKYYEWHSGWSESESVEEEMSYKVYTQERTEEIIAEKKQYELREHQKTKAGRAELAGQSTLF